MTDRIHAIRGMNDILPHATPYWRYIEQLFSRVLSSYAYEEIRLPILEPTALFKRTLGEVTDVVEKEMYTFNDLNGDNICLRPEGTASCVRACLEHGLLHQQQQQKLWYLGPMFRHERPQKGRYRQFTQLGVEVFGIAGSLIEVELIALSFDFWTQLGCIDALELQINTLGEPSEREAYKQKLVSYFQDHIDLLDEDSKKRLMRNPLRILDSKNPSMQPLISAAPQLFDSLGAESRNHFNLLCKGLDDLGIPYVVNPFLVRGLDYYGHTVFEWVTDRLGSQATLCAGGRYDLLVEQLGGHKTPAVGFALGLERVYLLLETLNQLHVLKPPISLFFVAIHNEAVIRALTLAHVLRQRYPEFKISVNTSLGHFKSQFKKADKSGADFALILGEEECIKNQISIKDLRYGSTQITVDQNQLIQEFASYLLQVRGFDVSI